MTAYLQPGDKIMLAVPDVHPGNTLAEDRAMWETAFKSLGIELHHLNVDHRLTHPVVVAVFRDASELADATTAVLP